MRTWLLYTALRLGIFGLAFGLLFALGLDWWIAAVAAAIIGFCVSYLTLGSLRMRVAEAFAAARENPTPSAGDDEEDAAIASEGDRRSEP